MRRRFTRHHHVQAYRLPGTEIQVLECVPCGPLGVLLDVTAENMTALHPHR